MVLGSGFKVQGLETWTPASQSSSSAVDKPSMSSSLYTPDGEGGTQYDINDLTSDIISPENECPSPRMPLNLACDQPLMDVQTQDRNQKFHTPNLAQRFHARGLNPKPETPSHRPQTTDHRLQTTDYRP